MSVTKTRTKVDFMRIKIFTIIVFALFFIDTTQPCNGQSMYLSYLDSAEVNIKAKKWQQAERHLLEALREEPAHNNNSLIISNLATVQRYQRKYVEALKNYDLALSMTPNAVTLLKNRASLFLELDSINRAYMDYEKVILLDTDDIESRYYHGLLSLRRGDVTVATADFADLLRIDESSPYTIEAQATLQKTLGNYDKAVDYFSKLISMQRKDSYEALLNRGECYLEMKRLNDAEKDIRAALAVAPEEPYLYVLRARLNKLRFNEADKERDIALAMKYGISRELAIKLIK